MTGERVYGDAVAHSFRLRDTPRLLTRSLNSSQIAINRLSLGAAQIGLSPRIRPEDTFIVAIYLTPVPQHELLSHGRPYIRQGYARHGMRIVNLVGEFSAWISHPHETVVLYIPRHALDELTYDAGLRRVSHLDCEPGIVDPVLAGLAETMSSALHRPTEVSQLFVDHLVLATSAHLLGCYSGPRSGSSLSTGGLSPWQAARAKAFLTERSQDDVTLGDLALYCGLSRSHVTRAFRITTGLTPHRWLLRYRVDRAKAMMLDTSLTIEGVAVACGFADQSHLTRVFTRSTGASPAAWRRQNRPRLRG